MEKLKICTADVEKCTEQIQVTEGQKYPKILWKKDPKEPIKEIKLTTVTYRTTSAPFLATRCCYKYLRDVQHQQNIKMIFILSFDG